MHRLAELSLANRALIALVTAAIAFFGIISMNSLKQELIPSVTLPVVTVVTSYPGASPPIVDTDVSRPIETAMQGLEGLDGTTTTSSANVSMVRVSFRYGTDLVNAQQRMQLAINRIQDSLPEGATTNILTGSIDDFPVVQLAVTGGDRDAVANLVRLEVLGDLTSLDGVRDAALSGAPTPRIAITPNQTLLSTFGVTAQTIRDTLDASGILIPIGQLTQGDETLTVQAGALLTTADDIAALPLLGVTNAGAPLTIGEIAAVRQDTEPVTTISRVNGEDSLTISITKRPDANTVAVSQAIMQALPDLEAKLGTGVSLVPVFDQAPFIEQSIETLVVEGLLGLAFAVVVIFVFLLSLRATIVTAISIPTSLLVTFIGLQAADYSLNILTLGALTIAIGRVVDDSIVVIENINRHMAMHPSASRRGPERAAVIVTAVREVAGAITASTISTVAVFLPIAFVSDISGELFRPFAMTSVIALLASLVVSLTIVPVLAYWTLGGAKVGAVRRGVDALRARRGVAAGAGAGGAGQDASGARSAIESRELVGAGAPTRAGGAGDSGTADPWGPARGAAGGDAAFDAAVEQQALRRVRPSEARAAADRELFSPLGLRDEPADSNAGSGFDTGARSGGDSGAGAVAGVVANDADAESDAHALRDLPRDPETGEIVLNRRTIRILRERGIDPTGELPGPIDAELVRDQASLASRPQNDPADGNEDVPAPLPRYAADADVADAAHSGDGTHPVAGTDAAAATDAATGTRTAHGTHPAADDVTDARPDGSPAAEPSFETASIDDLEHEPRTWLQRAYEPVLRFTLARPWLTLLAALLVLLLTGALAPLMKTNFLGETGGNTFTVSQQVAPNASLEARDAAATKVEDVLRGTEGVETVQVTISGGSLFAGFGGGTTPRASFSVITSDDADATAVQESAREQLEGRDDIGEVSIGGQGGGGFSSDLTVEVSAPTSELLGQATSQLADALQASSAFTEVSSSLDETRPFVRIDVDQATVAQYGLSEAMIGGMVAQQMQPVPVGSIAIDGESVRVYLVGDAPPQSLDELRAFPLPTPAGPLPLSTFATVEIVDGPVSIRAERGTPTATITLVPTTDDLSRSNADVQAVIDGESLPVGATAELGGVSADQQAAFEQLGLALLAAILIVYIVMVATFKSLLQPFLLLISIPFAATGAILLQLVTGVPLGVASIIGVLMLVGIVVTNAIVLVDLVNQFRARGLGVRDALIEGGSRRVRPILMTALATIFALIPMALGITGHSGFISQPLALVVIGGLLSSTVLTLLVLPALYAVVEEPRERRRLRREQRAETELAAAGLA